ncbi:hypothetical protein AWU65_11290 [Paenibacillus glucanolyticus]|uniref:Uncharacterized protein n=1 Tax=Paenibacillus glucanolyticus TaxID=59843 RepID=A0A163J9V0_9BACL|nr:hypothetical protein [Paenibacillus glucanolyticus]KZS46457.1 hypothetical protein AWU65_11290 [Paenibacillus glucanolyticus]
METKEENFLNDSTMESIKSLTEKDAKTFLNLIYALLKDNKSPSEHLNSNVLSIFEKQLPRVAKARQNKN